MRSHSLAFEVKRMEQKKKKKKKKRLVVVAKEMHFTTGSCQGNALAISND